MSRNPIPELPPQPTKYLLYLSVRRWALIHGWKFKPYADPEASLSKEPWLMPCFFAGEPTVRDGKVLIGPNVTTGCLHALRLVWTGPARWVVLKSSQIHNHPRSEIVPPDHPPSLTTSEFDDVASFVGELKPNAVRQIFAFRYGKSLDADLITAWRKRFIRIDLAMAKVDARFRDHLRELYGVDAANIAFPPSLAKSPPAPSIRSSQWTLLRLSASDPFAAAHFGHALLRIWNAEVKEDMRRGYRLQQHPEPQEAEEEGVTTGGEDDTGGQEVQTQCLEDLLVQLNAYAAGVAKEADMKEVEEVEDVLRQSDEKARRSVGSEAGRVIAGSPDAPLHPYVGSEDTGGPAKGDTRSDPQRPPSPCPSEDVFYSLPPSPTLDPQSDIEPLWWPGLLHEDKGSIGKMGERRSSVPNRGSFEPRVAACQRNSDEVKDEVDW